MKNMSIISKKIFLTSTFLSALVFVLASEAIAQSASSGSSRPPLLISNDGIPDDIREQVYSKPARTRDISASDLSDSGRDISSTVVGEKINDIKNQLSNLQASVAGLMANVNSMQKENEGKAAQYYADVATISTQLQSGTTKGNPRLVKRLQQAEASLENLGSSASTLSALSTDAQSKASEASYLLEATRAAYSLSGAVEEDHVQLAELEDAINNTSVIIERLLNNISDDITRTTTYMSSERSNLRALALAVDNGDLYGRSLAQRPFSSAGLYQQVSAMSPDAVSNSAPAAAATQAPAATQASLSGPRPLVKIRFDRTDVDYEQPVYMAVNEALHRYPNASFDLVAVSPTQGNAAQQAIESTRARRNAEKVLRTLTQMGLPLDQVNLSYSQSAEAKSNEVHLFIR
jgi:hypothetical protein